MRPRLLIVSIALLSCYLLGFSRSASADPLIVKTAQGKVHGKTINDGKVKAFLGLPYAAPPVGDLRWKAPQPAPKWKGTRDAGKFGAHCVQGHVYDDMIFQDDGENEDCLFLNVYVPATAKGNSKLPVMFWIHGGGYSGGSGDEPRHNGDFLPLKGVVLITINYRLGVFGFLATSDLAKEANGSAGNYGLMDMVAALQWVHNNIQKFGGDPANVTIFGESAGSFAVSTLMAVPSAQGLFAKAIGFALPERVGIRELILTSVIAGVGLTVALFVAGVAFTDPDIQGAAKMGALFSAGLAIVVFVLAKLLGVRPAERPPAP